MKLAKTDCAKKFLATGFLLCGFLISAHAQTEKQVVKIRAEVAAINKGVSKYTKTTKNVEDISLEGTEATYYRSNGNLGKITAKMYGETYNATGEFYYAGEKLIFVFFKRNQHDGQIETDTPPKVTRAEEQRFYFSAGDLIRLLIGEKELKSGDERYARLKDEIINISLKLENSYETAGFRLAADYCLVSKMMLEKK